MAHRDGRTLKKDPGRRSMMSGCHNGRKGIGLLEGGRKKGNRGHESEAQRDDHSRAGVAARVLDGLDGLSASESLALVSGGGLAFNVAGDCGHGDGCVAKEVDVVMCVGWVWRISKTVNRNAVVCFDVF